MSVHTLITGAGGITPMGQTQQELVDNLKAETSNISPMAILSKNLKASFWSPCVFNLKEDSPARDLPKSVYNDTLAISYVSILRALADAGLGLEVFASERTALVSAMGATGPLSRREHQEHHLRGLLCGPCGSQKQKWS